ncbi:MAG: phage integrase SAM-like domain-containing protein, partial [Parabacteroides sp.]|nr:phage integrase SAM-like domain-containing protein [Parabacteroides sp.]
MATIKLKTRTCKKKGQVNLRFRLTDGRSVELYHKSGIVADLSELAKINPDGTAKPRAFANKKLMDAIANEIAIMDKVYQEMVKQGITLSCDVFEQMLAEAANPVAKEREDEENLFLNRFRRYIEDSHRDGVIGDGRKKHYDVIANELQRFLIIKGIERILIEEVTADLLLSFRDFLFTEYKYVKKYRNLYDGMQERNIPKEARSSNTVAGKMKKLKAFFNDLEAKDEVAKSPFRRMGKTIVE